MPRAGDNRDAAGITAEASKEAARIQRQGAVQAARIGRSGTIGAAKLNTAGALGVAVIAGMAMVINTSVQGCYHLEQAKVTASASAGAAVEHLYSGPQVYVRGQDRVLLIQALVERYTDLYPDTGEITVWDVSDPDRPRITARIGE
ncbi:hypothetical protein [Couchioplanes caeruleus]|uniref:hypothetical protein n=1 Tax=Couchioplanes caeruleus TaxID=56438 RepID=UPI000AC8BF8C|nr:hypothetical protein [Couchioplanes caeruleus]